MRAEPAGIGERGGLDAAAAARDRREVAASGTLLPHRVALGDQLGDAVAGPSTRAAGTYSRSGSPTRSAIVRRYSSGTSQVMSCVPGVFERVAAALVRAVRAHPRLLARAPRATRGVDVVEEDDLAPRRASRRPARARCGPRPEPGCRAPTSTTAPSATRSASAASGGGAGTSTSANRSSSALDPTSSQPSSARAPPRARAGCRTARWRAPPRECGRAGRSSSAVTIGPRPGTGSGVLPSSASMNGPSASSGGSSASRSRCSSRRLADRSTST